MSAWRGYRINRWAKIASGSAGSFFLLAPQLSHPYKSGLQAWIASHPFLYGTALLLAISVVWVTTLNLVNWKCPRCGNLFQYTWIGQHSCKSCGLKKFEEP